MQKGSIYLMTSRNLGWQSEFLNIKVTSKLFCEFL